MASIAKNGPKIQYDVYEAARRIAPASAFLVIVHYQPALLIGRAKDPMIDPTAWAFDCPLCGGGRIETTRAWWRCLVCEEHGDGVAFLVKLMGCKPIVAARKIVKDLTPKPIPHEEDKLISLAEWTHRVLRQLRALAWLIDSHRQKAAELELLKELPALEAAIKYITEADPTKLERLRASGRLSRRWGIDARYSESD